MTVDALYRPDRTRFIELAADHRLVPVHREMLADLITPVGVYDRLRGVAGPTFLLESVERGERWGRYSFIGLRPLAVLSAGAGGVRLEGALPAEVAEAVARAGPDPLAAVATLLEQLTAPVSDELPPLWAGLVGYLGWDVVHAIERLPTAAADDLGIDTARLVLPGLVVAFDHLRQRLTVVANVLVGDDPARQYDEAVSEVEALLARLSEPVASPVLAPPRAQEVTDATSNMTPEAYLAAVETAKEHIRAGDVFQVVPAQRFALATEVDPLRVYRVLRVINPSPYMYVFDFGDLQIVGSSPEALVTSKRGRAEIWPIAGSRPRGRDDAEDAAHEATLRTDEKEVAEHVMLVDLARNDLGRVSVTGSVRVDELMTVVRYSHVMHLVSTVSGRLADGVGPVDLVRATFPAGTLSGAPKVRAMEIIDALEPTRRGVYAGGIGYLALDGEVDLCIAIRTLVFHQGVAYVQAGAGIVADSVGEAELAESRAKAMALLAAVRAAEALPGTAPRSRPQPVGVSR